MKIAYISGSYVPDRGADSVHVMAMCDALAQCGHDVTLCARPGTEPTTDDFAFYGATRSFRIEKVARPQVRVWGALVNAWLAGRRAQQSSPDLLYAREIFGLAVAARSGIPFVYELHWKPKHAVDRGLQRWLFRQPGFRRLVFISERLKDIYQETFPELDPSKLLVAHDAANVPELSSVRASEHDARLQVGYVGGFLPGYGIEVIVELARRLPELDFHIVGGREPDVRSWRADTFAISNLTFHGFVPPSVLPQRYAHFDVVLAPYQANTRHIDWISPMKLFEYMAYGKAIVCADFPVMREILDDGHNAILIPPSDIAAYESALLRLRDAQLRQTLGDNARAKLEREFTWRKRAELVLSGL